ncbi:MAG: response regulator transcription factor [Natronospirillum sp.]|uniref:response regulator n=1 Tax=Natronospirillum sp. TaxID=2812955 RepID=UPI0025CBB2EB|nr:response regulator transcription factor [Natronospirillum sp.]MCH8553208.1 response regulator transcription factor [Natronospirillum sp.]
MNKVLVIDDHPVYRRGMVSLIQAEADMQLCWEADSVSEAQRLIHELKPDILVLDLNLGEGSGLQLIKSLRTQGNHVPALVVSMYDETLFAERAIRAGANGYINKADAISHIVPAIRQVLLGKLFLSTAMAEELLSSQLLGKAYARGFGEARLSDREMEVYMMLGQGYATKRIATKLSISSKTVDSHKEHIKGKLGLTDNTSLIQHAVTWFMER